VNEGLIRYATTGHGDVKQPSGRDGFRLRIGAYRVIFNADATTILAIYIGRRSTITLANRCPAGNRIQGNRVLHPIALKPNIFNLAALREKK
jgi:mRNA interferase RelE/StbE